MRDGAICPTLSSMKTHLACGTQGWVRASAVTQAVLRHALSCAARATCIAPPGASLKNHRYDQSVLSALAHATSPPLAHHTEVRALTLTLIPELRLATTCRSPRVFDLTCPMCRVRWRLLPTHCWTMTWRVAPPIFRAVLGSKSSFACFRVCIPAPARAHLSKGTFSAGSLRACLAAGPLHGAQHWGCSEAGHCQDRRSDALSPLVVVCPTPSLACATQVLAASGGPRPCISARTGNALAASTV